MTSRRRPPQQPPPPEPPPPPLPLHTIRNLTGRALTLLLPDFTFLDLPPEGHAHVARQKHARVVPGLPTPAFTAGTPDDIQDLPPRTHNTHLIVTPDVFWLARRGDLFMPAVGPFDGITLAHDMETIVAVSRLIGPYRHPHAPDNEDEDPQAA